MAENGVHVGDNGEPMDQNYCINKSCIVRTVGAGVHIGTVLWINGQHAGLRDARVLWRWRGANTLREAAEHGVDMEWTRVSEPVAYVHQAACVEFLPIAPKAMESLTRSRWPA